MKIVTCIAPVNIAVIKYWGKRDDELILPINDSISSTLDAKSGANMCAKTTIMASPNFKDNKLWLNGKEENFDAVRLQNCLKEIKKRINPIGNKEDIINWNIHICSENNFPTAAGLASSAAGYACLVFALAKLYNIEGDISGLARRGSGSACRSIYGGWVKWCKGESLDGSDSLAVQLAPTSHWPDMRIIILVVNESRKKHSSTNAMKTSMSTSTLLATRAETIVPARINNMEIAIKTKDFAKFAELTMRDSNQFHAICLDTYPPCFYLNEVSHSIIEFVHAYNDFKKSTQVAYTYDAGPNACLYTLENNVSELISIINEVFPTSASREEYIKGIRVKTTELSQV
ncbi:diphosphomevalonate decarboxylase [Holotrichia oblita]|uniref:Diphosphomevalonate decarboxylase n=1 Tax=Holotrichia oblita TaxID=644536 RepID=A0ACB9TWT1_HOLOL|nr:diphosphomevalonate decarboxylase [Holotrichia oblita]